MISVEQVKIRPKSNKRTEGTMQWHYGHCHFALAGDPHKWMGFDPQMHTLRLVLEVVNGNT